MFRTSLAAALALISSSGFAAETPAATPQPVMPGTMPIYYPAQPFMFPQPEQQMAAMEAHRKTMEAQAAEQRKMIEAQAEQQRKTMLAQMEQTQAQHKAFFEAQQKHQQEVADAQRKAAEAHFAMLQKMHGVQQ
jgi:hypothetical protein